MLRELPEYCWEAVDCLGEYIIEQHRITSWTLDKNSIIKVECENMRGTQHNIFDYSK